jgi:hypothetical protein
MTARFLDALWIVLPSYSGNSLAALGAALISMVGIGGLWMSFFLMLWNRLIVSANATSGRMEHS